MSDETTLLPCPFCGGEADVMLSQSRWGQSYTIHHDALGKCPAEYVGSMQFATEAEAIAAWNTRAEMDYEDALILLDELGVSERTCKQEERGWGTEGDHARVWLTCGHDCMVPTVQDLPNYCPKCGARVMVE